MTTWLWPSKVRRHPPLSHLDGAIFLFYYCPLKKAHKILRHGIAAITKDDDVVSKRLMGLALRVHPQKTGGEPLLWDID